MLWPQPAVVRWSPVHAVAVGRTGRSLRPRSRPPLNAGIVRQTRTGLEGKQSNWGALMRLVVVPLLMLAYSAPSAAGDACAPFVVKVGGDRLDLAPPVGFVDVCSQDAALCRVLTQGYPPAAPTVGYFVTAQEWAQFKKGALSGFTNYLIAQISQSTTPGDLPGLKEFIRSRQGAIPDHTRLPDVLKAAGEVNLGVVSDTDDSIVFGRVAKLRPALAPDKEIVLIALNAALALGPRVLSLYTFRDYRSPADIASAKAFTSGWLQCLRGANPKQGLVAAPPGRQQAMQDVRSSHVDANVPDSADFERFLRRDLADYFAKARKRNVSVEYEPLRRGPTQSGDAYPKFYLWVTIGGGKSPQDRGAVRVAAIDKKRFEVTDFVSEEAVLSDPQGIYRIFPGVVCETINAKVTR